MPNIELHGYGRCAQSMKLKVRTALRELPSAASGEIVTTEYPTVAKDFQDKKKPFLRIIATADELPDLLDRLRGLYEDMEVMLLNRWIPGKT